MDTTYDVLNVVTGLNLAWYITSGFTADLQTRFKIGDQIKLFVDSEEFSDFTISETGISGTLVDRPNGVGDLATTGRGETAEPIEHKINAEDIGDEYSYRCAFYFRESNYEHGSYTEKLKSLVLLAINIKDSGAEPQEIYPYINQLHGEYSSRYTMSSLDEPYIAENTAIYDIFTNSSLNINSNNMYDFIENNIALGIELSSNIPIFDTYDNALAYIEDGLSTTGILNYAESPEEEYENMGEFYRLYNYYSINSNRGPTTIRSYRFKPYGQSKNRICFYRRKPTESDPTDLVLYHLNDSTCYSAYTVSPDDEDFDEVSSSVIPDKYISASRTYGNNYVKVYNFDSNIPIFKNKSLADDFVNEIIDIEEADNFEDLIREDNSITMADWEGTDTEDETDHGDNGQEYLVGARMYALTLTQLSAFFVEIFNGNNFQAFLDGTQIFGQNQINAITGLSYLPLTDLSPICSLQSATNISVGAWQSGAQGVPIKNNKGLIDCGTFTMAPTYNDFRDLEPYFTLSVWLPYVGCYPLSMAKYLGKRVNVSYAVDVTTGGCTAYVSADGIVLDSFDGTMGSQRPITSQDNARWLSSVVNGIMDVSGQIAGGSTSAIQGALSGASGGNIVSAVGGGMISAATTGVSGVYKGYELMNTFNDPPMSTRGAYCGNLGYFGSQKVRFIIGQKRSSRPKNELNLIGYPSNTSGYISDYNGFLKCSTVKLSGSFNGTLSEQTELLNILRNGIYV